MSRQGKHREGKVSVGIYVDEDFRALFALVVDQEGETATDIIIQDVCRRAERLGIMCDGKIVEEYKPVIELVKAEYAEKRRKAQQKRKGAKKNGK